MSTAARIKTLELAPEPEVRDEPSLIPPPPESGVRVAVERQEPERSVPVTLIVYGWETVEPGILSWVFPSLASALFAAGAMKNATRWAVLMGARAHQALDVDEERASGRVLAEA